MKGKTSGQSIASGQVLIFENGGTTVTKRSGLDCWTLQFWKDLEEESLPKKRVFLANQRKKK